MRPRRHCSGVIKQNWELSYRSLFHVFHGNSFRDIWCTITFMPLELCWSMKFKLFLKKKRIDHPRPYRLCYEIYRVGDKSHNMLQKSIRELSYRGLFHVFCRTRISLQFSVKRWERHLHSHFSATWAIDHEI